MSRNTCRLNRGGQQGFQPTFPRHQCLALLLVVGVAVVDRVGDATAHRAVVENGRPHMHGQSEAGRLVAVEFQLGFLAPATSPRHWPVSRSRRRMERVAGESARPFSARAMCSPVIASIAANARQNRRMSDAESTRKAPPSAPMACVRSISMAGQRVHFRFAAYRISVSQ